MSESASPELSADILRRIIEVGRRLNSTIDLHALLTKINEEAADMLGSEASSILLYDPQINQLRFRATSGKASAQLENKLVPLEGSIAGDVFRKCEPLIVDNVNSNEQWNPSFDEQIEFQTRAILGVPLLDGSSNAVGVLEAINKIDGRFGDTDVAVLSTLADLAGVAISKAQLFGELQRAYNKLDELDRLKSDFIALASHELRTPLSIILGYVSFLRAEVEGAQAEQLDHMLRAAVRLRSLIQDMLNLKYVDTGQTSLNLRRINLVSLVRQVVTERDDTAVAKQQSLYLHLPPQPLTILGERDMLEVVVSNLLNNAIKFTPEGGRIDVGVAARQAEAWLYVRDTGEGIARDQLERIFDRFYQVEPHMRRRFEGMGIGLSIVKELVEMHDGRVWVESRLGRGSEFYVSLPIVDLDE